MHIYILVPFMIYVLFSALSFIKIAFLCEKSLKETERREKIRIHIASHISAYAWGLVGAVSWPLWIVPMCIVYAMHNWRMRKDVEVRVEELFRVAEFYHGRRTDGYGLEATIGAMFRGLVWERDNMNDFQFRKQLERAADLVESWYPKR